MEQNYYDILEVSKNASPEIIEKAYKTLVKKYHPDLQKDSDKNKYEEKIKKINEAYDILSDSEQRKKYDFNLKNTEISLNDYNSLYQENINLKNNLNILKEKLNYLNNNQNNYEKNTFYYNNMKNNNIRNNNNNLKSNIIFNLKKRIKDLIALLITIIIFIFIFFILWHIPFTKNYLINLYNENIALEYIINLFINIFK